jgi:hypothetical protein
MEIEVIGKSVNAPEFLKALEKDFDWFVSYSLMVAEKHFEDPGSEKIYVAVALIGDYRWDIHTVRFEEVTYKKDRTERREVATPPDVVVKLAADELNQAYERAKELPPEIKKRLEKME